MPNRRRIYLAGIGALLLVFVGCGSDIHGRWRLREIQPAMGNEDFKILQASFYRNGSFEMVAMKCGEMFKTKGTYDYCDCKDRLTLITADQIRTYEADTEDCNDRLDLTCMGEDEIPTTTILIRHFKCPYYAKCDECP
jgi:hypothetical protein